MTYQQAHDVLAEYQQWRRGEGRYAWDGEPAKYPTAPFTPSELGEAIDVAVRACEAMREWTYMGSGK